MTHADLPPDVRAYKETPVFTETSMPKGLLADHRTAKGVWGVLTVLSGALSYTRKGHPPVTVTPKHPAVIYPQELHHIACPIPVQFKVVFHR